MADREACSSPGILFCRENQMSVRVVASFEFYMNCILALKLPFLILLRKFAIVVP